MNLDELERLYKAATPGEWKATDYGDEKRPMYCVDFPDEDAAIWSDGGGIEPNSFTQSDRDKANVELVAALHNAFPDLLALARDGERYRWLRDERTPQWDLRYWKGYWDSPLGAELDAAIDAARKGEQP